MFLSNWTEFFNDEKIRLRWWKVQLLKKSIVMNRKTVNKQGSVWTIKCFVKIPKPCSVGELPLLLPGIAPLQFWVTRFVCTASTQLQRPAIFSGCSRHITKTEKLFNFMTEKFIWSKNLKKTLNTQRILKGQRWDNRRE